VCVCVFANYYSFHIPKVRGKSQNDGCLHIISYRLIMEGLKVTKK